ncbi:hypothetical protein TWF694_005768 [Orbilia ellipsospora]|uniref:BTB domain-containing protein n=1 Tax=Orbilia ellipsospora TaxID=2528407 RepID=A0AAV9WRX2_9PEZI
MMPSEESSEDDQKQQQISNQSRTALLQMLENKSFSDITIFVGPTRVPFHLHKVIICASSPFFQAALKPRTFKESIASELRLPEIDPTVFWNVVWWMYGGTEAGTSSINRRDDDITKTYAAAEFLLMKEYRRDILLRATQLFSEPLALETTDPEESKKKDHPVKVVREICAIATTEDWDILMPVVDAVISCYKLNAKVTFAKRSQPELMSALVMELVGKKLNVTMCKPCQKTIITWVKGKEQAYCNLCDRLI